MTCPDRGSLLALLEEANPGADTGELDNHIETCPTCLRTLAELTQEEAIWKEAAGALTEATRSEPALRALMEAARSEPPGNPHWDLSFLRPAGEPGVLGLLGSYRVLEECGRGSMGVVLKARDPALERVVAIKVLPPWLAANDTARQRFVREGRAAAAVCHDHVVAVHGVAEADGVSFIIMQLVAGESLQARLDQAGPLAVSEAVRVGQEVALALAAAHSHGLIHRDVKPANILLEDGSDRVKLTDFGLARLVDDVGLTQNGVVAGTPEYMAPEQARGDPVDHRADLFSLGSVLYAMLTGSSPFHGSTTLGVLRRVCDQEPCPVNSLNQLTPPWLDNLVARLLAKDPADRFQTAAEVAALLRTGLDHLDQPSTIPAPEVMSAPAGSGVALAAGWAPNQEASAGMSKRRTPFPSPLVFAVLWTAGGICLLALVFWMASSMRDRFFHDFRVQRLPGAVRPFGPQAGRVVREEPDGLRITLSRDRPHKQSVGVTLAQAVSGDFEVTATVEILQADVPPPFGFGAGVLMTADETARIGRLNRARKEQVALWDQWIKEEGKKPKLIGDIMPCPANVVRLRMKRIGSTLAYLWAPEADGGDFQLMHEGEFRSDDVRVIKVMASTGSQPCDVDVRILELRVATAPTMAQVIGWMAGTMAAVVVGGAAGWYYLQRRVCAHLPATGQTALAPRSRPLVKERVHSAASTAITAGRTAEHLSVKPHIVTCPGCQKRLKLSAGAGGKKVTCPACEASFVG
jgi:serine/threonine-protein kinase